MPSTELDLCVIKKPLTGQERTRRYREKIAHKKILNKECPPCRFCQKTRVGEENKIDCTNISWIFEKARIVVDFLRSTSLSITAVSDPRSQNLQSVSNSLETFFFSKNDDDSVYLICRSCLQLFDAFEEQNLHTVCQENANRSMESTLISEWIKSIERVVISSNVDLPKYIWHPLEYEDLKRDYPGETQIFSKSSGFIFPLVGSFVSWIFIGKCICCGSVSPICYLIDTYNLQLPGSIRSPAFSASRIADAYYDRRAT